MKKMKVMWFSRHLMTEDQAEKLISKLGEIEVTHVNGTAPNVHVPFLGEIDGVVQEIAPLKELIKDFNVIAVVMPIGLLQQILPFAGERPVIQALNKRLFNGGEKITFAFEKWQRVKKIEIELEDF